MKRPLVSIGWRLLFVIIATLVVDGNAQADETQPSNSIGIESVAARLFFKIGASSTEYITKWVDDTHVGLVLDDAIKPQSLAKFAEYLSLIQETTKHTITVTEKTNFVVIFTSDINTTAAKHGSQISQFFADRGAYENFISLFRTRLVPCGSKILLSPDRSIGAFLLVVLSSNDSDQTEVNKCVLRGLIKGMGVLGEAADQTSFSLQSGDDEFSNFDEVVLRLLYDPNIQSGAQKAVSLPVIAGLLERLPRQTTGGK